MIPTTIEQLAATRPTSHGSVTDQEIRVGQMLLAQSVIALTKRIDTLLAAVEREPELEEPKPAKAPRAPREPKPAPAPKPPPAPAHVVPPAPAPKPSPAPVTVTVPADVSRLSHQAYLDGYAAGLVGEASDANPYQGATRGINGGRRLAWSRGYDDARAA